MPVAGINIPDATLADITNYQRLWGAVFADHSTRANFKRDPGKYLRGHSLPDKVLLTNDAEVRLLQALTDDEILTTAISGDYRAFLARLNELGLIQRVGPSNFKRQIAQAMRQNLPEIRSRASAIASGDISGVDPGLRGMLESKELRYLYTQLTPSIEQVAMASVPVAIAAIVVTFVSVAIGVTIAIAAGVYISIAVATAVTASAGPHVRSKPIDTLLASAGNVLVAKATGKTVREREIERAMAARILIGKRLLALDPERLEQAHVIARAARLLNQDDFILEANRQLVRDEIAMFVEAAEDIDLVRIPSQSRATVVQTIERLALRAAALD